MMAVLKRVLIGACALLLLACDTSTQSETVQPAEKLDEGLVNPGHQEKPDWFKQSFLDIREDMQEATEEGRRLLLYFYQDGCPYCQKLLDVNFSQRDIATKTQKYFDVVAINLWGDREVYDLMGEATTEKQFAEALKVMFTPTMLLLDEAGQVVMRLNGYYPPQKFEAVIDYVGQQKEKQTNFRKYWASNSPPAATGVLHQQDDYLPQPYQLAARENAKPLVVMFEQKDCSECDELHLDILKRKESLELMAQFEVALVDIWSDMALVTPDGSPTTVAEWAEKLKVQYTPTLVLFDKAGQEVFRTEAYLKAFHVQSALDYVLSSSYLEQPNFQRYIQSRADAFEAQGIHVDIMK
jgi:thioredoxin-related protein